MDMVDMDAHTAGRSGYDMSGRRRLYSDNTDIQQIINQIILNTGDSNPNSGGNTATGTDRLPEYTASPSVGGRSPQLQYAPTDLNTDIKFLFILTLLMF